MKQQNIKLKNHGTLKRALKFVTKPEGFFLLLASLFGFLFVFLTPPIQAPDEDTHLFQAYQYSNFHLLPDKYTQDGVEHYGPELPTSVFNSAELFKNSVAGKPDQTFKLHLYKQYLSQPLNPSVKEHKYSGNSYASPVPYIPQATGINVGKLFGASPLIIIWLGRLANLIAWLIIVYTAIRLLPFAKWAMVILALNPVVVFLSGSLSADVIEIALSFLFFSLIARAYVARQPQTKPQKAMLLVVLALLVLAKPVNIVFSALLFAIPTRLFRSKMQFFTFALVGIGMAVLLVLLTNHVSAPIMQLTARDLHLNVHPAQQAMGIINAPFSYIKDLISNYVIVSSGSQADAVLLSFFGIFGWLDTSIPLWVIELYIVALIMVLLYQFGRGATISYFQKLTLLVTATLLIIGNITAMYIYWTPSGSNIIYGVQGRYFIPAAILGLGLFTARKKLLYISDRTLFRYTAVMMSIVLMMTALRIFLRYYS